MFYRTLINRMVKKLVSTAYPELTQNRSGEDRPAGFRGSCRAQGRGVRSTHVPCSRGAQGGGRAHRTHPQARQWTVPPGSGFLISKPHLLAPLPWAQATESTTTTPHTQQRPSLGKDPGHPTRRDRHPSIFQAKQLKSVLGIVSVIIESLSQHLSLQTTIQS